MTAATAAGADPPSGSTLRRELQSTRLTPVPSRPRDPAPKLFREPADMGDLGRFRLRFPDPTNNVHELVHLSVFGGVCTGDFDNDGLADIFITSPDGGSRLYRNVDGERFEDVTVRVGVDCTGFWATGAIFVDIDNDHDLDLHVCGYRQPNRLYINQGSEGAVPGGHRFREEATRFGLNINRASMQLAFADFDKDGDLDAYLATTAAPPPPGVSFRVTYEGPKPVIPPELSEFWAMIYLPGERVQLTEAGQRDRLLRNDVGRFVDVSTNAGIAGAFFTLAAAWWDQDGDGWPDLYAANDYLGPDQLYRNNRDGTFTECIRTAIPHTPWASMGVDVGDLDGDGRIDLVATDMLGTTHARRQVMAGQTSRTDWFLTVAEPRQYRRNALYLATGTPRVLEAATLAAFAATDWTWGPRIEDFDGDGDNDVFFANGVLRDTQHSDRAAYADRQLRAGSPAWSAFWASQPPHRETNIVMRNEGGLRFTRAEAEWGLDRFSVSLGTATADFNNDGHLDLIINNGDGPPSIHLNQGMGFHTALIRLRGRRSNSQGIGALVEIESGGQRQTRPVTLARSWLSASDPVLHFGLGRETNIQRVVIRWPSGITQELTHLPAGHLHTITEPAEARPSPPAPAAPGPVTRSPWFQAAGNLSSHAPAAAQLDHLESNPLLPWRPSRRAFAFAAGEINQDGRTDFVLGGAHGQPAQVLVREPGGNLRPQPLTTPGCLTEFVDLQAGMDDVDADGIPEVWLLSLLQAPGSENTPQPCSALRLYRKRDGERFAPWTPQGMPPIPAGAQCLAFLPSKGNRAARLFISGGPAAGDYPLPGSNNRILERAPGGSAWAPAGNGTWSCIGVPTAALWADLDGDADPELVVTEEWGPIRIHAFRGNTREERTAHAGLAQLRGWWRCIAAGDLDHDGDLDLVAGNLGLNTRYTASTNRPFLLFHGDLAGSGNRMLLEAAFEGELGYPLRGLDALSMIEPGLKTRFPSFESFSRAPIEEIFSMRALAQARRWEVATAASVILINDGHGHFTPHELPYPAQLAPVSDLALADLDLDGHPDLVAAQNDFSAVPETGHMDGGLSLVLRGDGKGRFTPLPALESGLAVPGETRRVLVTDLNDDQAPDLVLGISAQTPRIHLNLHPAPRPQPKTAPRRQANPLPDPQ